jgi:hypothetical protein
MQQTNKTGFQSHYSLKIEYIEIDCKHQLAIEYPNIQKEVRQLMDKENNLEKKKWICLEPRAFKKVIMRLNTKNAEMVRDYYLNLEEAMFAYGEYTMNYLVEKTEREWKVCDGELSLAMEQLAIKDKELEDERKAREDSEKQRKIAELRAITLTRLNVAFQERAKTQIFYIATSKDNEFKIGLLKKRLSMYNTGNSGVHQDLTMFFVEVSNYKQMEMRMKELIYPFRST